MESTNEQFNYQAAEIQLSYTSKVKPSLRPKITSSKDAYKVLVECWDKTQIEFVEQFKVILLNRANRVLGIYTASTGGPTGTIADPKVIFAAAIKSNACGIILAHNHPSGNTAPSQQDTDLTKKIREGGKILEIKVLDHLILSVDSYFSFSDENLT